MRISLKGLIVGPADEPLRAAIRAPGRVLCGLVGMALLAAGALRGNEALAQATAGQTQQSVQSESAADTDQLQEVVVTAQFRREAAQSAPIAITAINAAMLEQRGQTNLADVANDAPSVTLKQAGAAFGPSMVASIRGIGQSDFDPALEPGVGIYVDDVYFATLTGSLLDLMDLDRVEILRGPQGTLAGKNSIGGSVKLYSQKPTEEAQSTFSLLYGSRNHVEARGSTNFVIAPDRLFVRISGVVNHQDGYSDMYDFGCANPGLGVPSGFVNPVGGCKTGTAGGKDYGAARIALRWLATDDVEVNLSGDFTHDVSESPATTLIYANNPGITYYGLPYNQNVVPLIPSNRYSSYQTYCLPPLSNFFSGSTTPAYCGSNSIHMVSWGGAATVDWKLSDTLSLKSITAQRGYTSEWFENNSASPWPLNLGSEHLGHHQFSQEVRLNGSVTGLVDYTVGGFYLRELSPYGTHQDLPYVTQSLAGTPLGFLAAFPGSYDLLGNDSVLAHTKAGFAHAVWHLTDKADLTTGVRYTSEDKDYKYVRLMPDEVTPFPLLTSLNGFTGVYSGSKTDYRADLSYHWTEDLMTYAQVSTGFKGGGVNPRPFNLAQARPFSPENLTNYELGWKSSWLDHKLRANLDGFYGKYKDIQETLLSCPQYGGPGPCALPVNAGDADIKGIEFETEFHPIAGLELDGSLSYIDFKFTTLTPGTGLTPGMVPPYTPKKKGNVGVQYAIPFGAAGSLVPRFDISYEDSIFTNSVNTTALDPEGNFNRVPAYALMNLRFTWKPEKGDWEAAVQVLNLTDKFYYLSKFDLTGAGAGEATGQPGAPREIDFQIKHSM